MSHFTTVLRAYGQALARWRLILPLYLFLHGLSLSLIAPALGLLINGAVGLSDRPALTDQDIALYLLTPAGFLVALVVMSVLLVAEIAGFAVLAAAVRQGGGGWGAARRAILTVLSRLKALVVFSGMFILRVLAVALPFALAGLLVAMWYLTDFDINYYLTFRPPEFLLAMGIIAALALAMAIALLFRLSGWALTPHLLLFEARDPHYVFGQSQDRMEGRRGQLQIQLLIWFLLRLGGSNLMLAAAAAGLHLMVPGGEADLRWVVWSVLLLFGLWVLGNLLLGALALSALAELLDRFFDPAGERHEISVDERPVGSWLVVSACVVLALAGVASWSAEALFDAVRTTDRVRIIAHRGAAGSRPENTVAAIEQAIADGADWVEVDVQESADGRIVVVHDGDLMKLAGIPLEIRKGTYSELRQVDVGSWFDPAWGDQRIPLLSEILVLTRDRVDVMIELKHYGYDVDLERRVVQEVEAAGMADQVAIMSLNYPSVLKARHLRPDWRSGVLAASAVGNLAGLQGDFLAVRAAIASPGLVNAVGSAGKELFVWTVNDPLEMSRMISKGVDGLITDEPALARQVLDARSRLNSAERMALWLASELGVVVNPKGYRDENP